MSEVKESKFIKWACYAVPILFAIYVMSIGPAAAFLCDSNGNVIHPEYEKQFTSFYAPLILIITSNKLFLNAYVSYVNICNDSNISID